MASMIRTRWSKLRREVESRFADSIAGRVTIFMTGYRSTHGEAGRWAIVVDGVEVGGTGDWNSWRSNPAFCDSDGDASWEEGEAEVRGRGLHERDMVLRSLREYLSLSIEHALTSPDALIRSLAILDRRTGKVRLRNLLAMQIGTPLEKHALELRCLAEGIRPDKATEDG